MIKSVIAFTTILTTATLSAAQVMPADYKGVLDALGRQGDFKDGVLKVNIPAVAIAMVGLLTLRSSAQGTAPKTPMTSQTVLFVCEHGAVRSVIAAAHFNKVARERGLPYRAVARGAAPDAEIPAGVRKGLEQEGLELSIEKPVTVGQADVNGASRVVTFEIALPGTISSSKAAPTDWRAVPPVSAGFEVASADIKRRVEALIDELSKK